MELPVRIFPGELALVILFRVYPVRATSFVSLRLFIGKGIRRGHPVGFVCKKPILWQHSKGEGCFVSQAWRGLAQSMPLLVVIWMIMCPRWIGSAPVVPDSFSFSSCHSLALACNRRMPNLHDFHLFFFFFFWSMILFIAFPLPSPLPEGEKKLYPCLWGVRMRSVPYGTPHVWIGVAHSHSATRAGSRVDVTEALPWK